MAGAPGRGRTCHGSIHRGRPASTSCGAMCARMQRAWAVRPSDWSLCVRARLLRQDVRSWCMPEWVFRPRQMCRTDDAVSYRRSCSSHRSHRQPTRGRRPPCACSSCRWLRVRQHTYRARLLAPSLPVQLQRARDMRQRHVRVRRWFPRRRVLVHRVRVSLPQWGSLRGGRRVPLRDRLCGPRLRHLDHGRCGLRASSPAVSAAFCASFSASSTLGAAVSRRCGGTP